MKPSFFDSFIKPKESIKNKETPEGDFIFFLEGIYAENKNSIERVDKIISELELFFKYISKNILSENEQEKIKDTLQTFRSVEERSVFINGVYECLERILEIQRKYPREYEEASSRGSNEKNNYLELNRLVSYEKAGDTVQLHHSYAKTIGPKRQLYNDAMQKLAIIIKNDPQIQRIEATSWIVAKMPTLFTQKGFIVENVITSSAISSLGNSFGGKKDLEEGVATASMGREKFLEVFGDTKDN
jgi:hypothetical protein